MIIVNEIGSWGKQHRKKPTIAVSNMVLTTLGFAVIVKALGARSRPLQPLTISPRLPLAKKPSPAAGLCQPPQSSLLPCFPLIQNIQNLLIPQLGIAKGIANIPTVFEVRIRAFLYGKKGKHQSKSATGSARQFLFSEFRTKE